MHSQLNTYLARVSAQLRLMPGAQREEALREMRQHLTKLAADGQERGLVEEDAVQEALCHFGSPEIVGRQMARTWWRGYFLSWWRSAVVTAAMAGLALHVPEIVLNLLFPPHTIAPGTIAMRVVPLQVNILCLLFAGGYVGWRLSSRSLRTVIGGALLTAIFGSLLTFLLLWPAGQGMHLPTLSFERFTWPVGTMAALFLGTGAFAMPFVAAAAATSRAWARRQAT